MRVLVIPIVVVVVQFAEVLVMMGSVKLLGSILASFAGLLLIVSLIMIGTDSTLIFSQGQGSRNAYAYAYAYAIRVSKRLRYPQLLVLV